MRDRSLPEQHPERPGDFASRPLRKGEAFDLRDALAQRKHAVELWEGFEEFGVSINAIGSILATDRATLFPLPGALEWLVKSLRRWHDANGQLTMDQAMGLTPTYRGGETDATRAARLKREQTTARHMAQLVALGFSARAASGMVAGALQSAKGSTLPPVTAATIAREWPRLKRENGWLPLCASEARAMTPAECKAYLQQFDGPALPKRKRGE